jgi:hypothetical protein
MSVSDAVPHNAYCLDYTNREVILEEAGASFVEHTLPLVTKYYSAEVSLSCCFLRCAIACFRALIASSARNCWQPRSISSMCCVLVYTGKALGAEGAAISTSS